MPEHFLLGVFSVSTNLLIRKSVSAVSVSCLHVCLCSLSAGKDMCVFVSESEAFPGRYVLVSMEAVCVRACVCLCVCVHAQTCEALRAALCFALSSAECRRGRILGGDGQGSNGLVSLRLRGGSDASQPR